MAAAKSKPAPQAVSHPAHPPLPAWLMALLLALATLALYWPAMQNGFVNFDDDRYVTANSQVQKGLSPENLRWAFINPVADNWHPLTVLSHMFVCQFAGLNPWGHHFVNVLLHAANAALVFVLLRQLTGAFWRSLFVAALFAVHPLRVESVAWVAERKDVLSGLFGLMTLIFYARHARPNESQKDGGHSIFSGNYWLALLFFALGLMSKPMLVTWPFVLLLLDYWPLKRISNPETSGGRQLSIPKLVLEKVPFFILAAMVSVATFAVQQHGAAVKTVQAVPLAIRGENSLIACCRYLEKTFWPADLAVFYPLPDNWPMWEVFMAAGFLVAVSALVLVQRGRQPYLPVGWFWFLGTLIPVIGLVQVGLQAMADRYTYLPSLGISMLVVWGAGAMAVRWRLEALVVVAGLAAVVTCAVLTRLQLPYWQDGETLFRRALTVTQNNSIAHYNLAVALDNKNRLADAASEYQAVLQIQPGNTLARLNLGADLYQSGHSGEAIAQYQEVIRLEPNNDKVHNNLGIVLFRQGQNDEAIKEFQAAVRLAPDNASDHNSLAAALYTQGHPDEALQQFQEALRLQPAYAEAHFNLACLLAQRGQTGEAIKHFQEAIRLKPDYPEARDRLEKTLQAQGK